MTAAKKQIGQSLRLADGTVVPLSPGMVAGPFVFVSGQLGLGCDGKLAGADITSQTEQVFANITTVLGMAKLGLENVVKVTGWLTDPADFGEFNRVYAGFFPLCPPARSMVVGQLLIPGARVELEAIALADCKSSK